MCGGDSMCMCLGTPGCLADTPVIKSGRNWGQEALLGKLLQINPLFATLVPPSDNSYCVKIHA